MSRVINIRALRLGEGRPKICIPLLGAQRRELLEEARQLRQAPADLAEWRVDHWKDPEDLSELETTLGLLREVLGDMPLLFTFRTAQEGGKRPIDPEGYLHLLLWAIGSGKVDLVDVELFSGDDLCKQVIEAAHRQGIAVVVSSHDFSKTPPAGELMDRLRRMRALGGDLPKIAVMPGCPADVLTLLSVTEVFHTEADCPVITMSMGWLGSLSRVAGEFFGSVLTFGTVGRSSAPGQLKAEELEAVLKILEKPQNG